MSKKKEKVTVPISEESLHTLRLLGWIKHEHLIVDLNAKGLRGIAKAVSLLQSVKNERKRKKNSRTR